MGFWRRIGIITNHARMSGCQEGKGFTQTRRVFLSMSGFAHTYLSHIYGRTHSYEHESEDGKARPPSWCANSDVPMAYLLDLNTQRVLVSRSVSDLQQGSPQQVCCTCFCALTRPPRFVFSHFVSICFRKNRCFFGSSLQRTRQNFAVIPLPGAWRRSRASLPPGQARACATRLSAGPRRKK